MGSPCTPILTVPFGDFVQLLRSLAPFERAEWTVAFSICRTSLIISVDLPTSVVSPFPLQSWHESFAPSDAPMLRCCSLSPPDAAKFTPMAHGIKSGRFTRIPTSRGWVCTVGGSALHKLFAPCSLLDSRDSRPTRRETWRLLQSRPLVNLACVCHGSQSTSFR